MVAHRRVIMQSDRSWWALWIVGLASPVLLGGLYAGLYFAICVPVPVWFGCSTGMSMSPPTVVLATYPRIPNQHWWLFTPMHTLDRQLRPQTWLPEPTPITVTLPEEPSPLAAQD
jgi:hypothetical protein